MPKYSKPVILEQMASTGLIPVFNHHDKNTAAQVLVNAYEAGIKVFEFTNRGDNSSEVFNHLVQVAQGLDGLILGIGTIWTAQDALKFLDIGAEFIVSPGLVPEIADKMNQENVLWIPGCGTVSEVNSAIRLGAELVKIFPGNVLGAEFVKAVKSVLPEVKIMPTGGVKPTAENLGKWFGAGVHCVGMGSQLFSKNLIASGNYAELQDEISDALSLVRSVRKNV